MPTRYSFVLWLLPMYATSATEVDFLRDIRPILTARCVRCHSESLEQEGGLKLDKYATLLQGGEHGAVVVASKSGESALLARVTARDESRMPPTGEPLTAAQLELLKNWIDQGARGPSADAENKVDHWAFRKPQQPPPPRPTDAAFADSAVDAFLRATQEEKQLAPVAEAPRATLLRRVYFDLIGLPPTTDELSAFLSDAEPDAFDRVVDRLLASPRYGERWGRHWMDVWRYSDWDGYGGEIRESKPHIWRWREWILESLNADKSYGRMVEEMLAGDELAPDDPQTLRATGFLVRNWYKFNRNTWLDNTVEHTGKAFLGLTFNCARCHNHMYDPIAQTEFYALRAVFEPHDIRTDRVPREANIDKDGLVRVFDAKADAPTYLFTRGNEKEPQKDRPISPASPKVFDLPLAIAPVSLPPAAYNPALQEFVQEESLATARQAIAAAEAALEAAKHKGAEGDAAREVAIAEKSLVAAQAQLGFVAARIAADVAAFSIPPATNAKELAAAAGKAEREAALAAAVKNALAADWKVEQAKRAVQPGNAATEKALKDAEAALVAARKAQEVAAAAALQPTENYTRLLPVHPVQSTGRRLAFARFITSPENPLFARVAVNHVWLRHFGAPLVPTMFDFGMNGKPASHPELLDWLASEFRDRGGEFKALHRLLVTSRTYRSASTADTHSTIDADNRYPLLQNNRPVS